MKYINTSNEEILVNGKLVKQNEEITIEKEIRDERFELVKEVEIDEIEEVVKVKKSKNKNKIDN